MKLDPSLGRKMVVNDPAGEWWPQNEAMFTYADPHGQAKVPPTPRVSDCAFLNESLSLFLLVLFRALKPERQMKLLSNFLRLYTRNMNTTMTQCYLRDTWQECSYLYCSNVENSSPTKGEQQRRQKFFTCTNCKGAWFCSQICIDLDWETASHEDRKTVSFRPRYEQ